MISGRLYRAFWVLGRGAHRVCGNEKAPPARHPAPASGCIRSWRLAAFVQSLWLLGADVPVDRLPLPLQGLSPDSPGEEPPRVPAEMTSHPVPFTDTRLACVLRF